MPFYIFLSCVGVWDDGKGRVDIIPNDQGNRSTPTYVAFSGGHKGLIGDAAENQAISNTRNTYLIHLSYSSVFDFDFMSLLLRVFHVKRLLGRKFDSLEVQSNLKNLPFEIFSKGEIPYIRVEHGGMVKELVSFLRLTMLPLG